VLEKESMQVHSVADYKADYLSTLHFLSTKGAESAEVIAIWREQVLIPKIFRISQYTLILPKTFRIYCFRNTDI